MTKKEMAKIIYDALISTDKSCFATELRPSGEETTLDGRFDFYKVASIVLKAVE